MTPGLGLCFLKNVSFLHSPAKTLRHVALDSYCNFKANFHTTSRDTDALQQRRIPSNSLQQHLPPAPVGGSRRHLYSDRKKMSCLATRCRRRDISDYSGTEGVSMVDRRGPALLQTSEGARASSYSPSPPSVKVLPIPGHLRLCWLLACMSNLA